MKSDTFLRNPEKYGAILTGTHAWGIATERSDYDYIVTEDPDGLSRSAIVSESYPDSAVVSKKYNVNGKVVNLLVMDKEEAEAWTFATTCIGALCQAVPVFKQLAKKRDFRVKMFASFLEAYRDQMERIKDAFDAF